MRNPIGLFCFIFFFVSTYLAGQNNPPLIVNICDSSATDGYFFLAPYKLAPPYNYDHPQLILDRYGNTVYYRVFFSGGIASTTSDFKLHANGLMSFFSPLTGRFYLMDSTFTVVDSLTAIGFDTDTHELQILDDGHYLILGRESRTMNLTGYQWFGANHNLPGSPNAQVTGSVIQELDENKILIFQWNAHDHFDFGDVDPVWLNNPSSVDWTHSNALERDWDGNILLSSRHFNEITKINRQNGQIMWRWGGKRNQLTFINDSVGFTGQHDIRRQANGHLTLWDNGQYTDPPVGRALEYSLDETAKTAYLVWEYIYDSAMVSYAMGNHMVTDTSRRLVTFGFVNPQFPMVLFIHNNKTKIMEIFGPPEYGIYRSFHYPSLPFTIHRPEITTVPLSNGGYILIAESGHSQYKWSNGAASQSISVTTTGNYQVFVPLGGGYAGSEVITVVVKDTLLLQGAILNQGEIECYDALQTIIVAGMDSTFTVQAGGSATMIAGQNIVYLPGTKVDSGGYMHGYISTEFCTNPSYPVAGNPQGAADVTASLNEATDATRVIIYPNPTTGMFTLEQTGFVSDQTLKLEIYTMLGKRVISENIAGEKKQQFNLGDAPAGIYLVRIIRGGKVETVKLVKQ